MATLNAYGKVKCRSSHPSKNKTPNLDRKKSKDAIGKERVNQLTHPVCLSPSIMPAIAGALAAATARVAAPTHLLHDAPVAGARAGRPFRPG